MKKIIVLFALICCLLPFNFSKADICETKCCSDPAGCGDQNAFCKANPPNNIASPTACTNESLPANCSANETKICCCSTSVDQKYIVGQATTEENPKSPMASLNFTPEISIPGLISGNATSTPVGKLITSVTGDVTTVTMKSDLLARYIQAIYNYALAIVSILAAIVLMGGGLMWLTSGGDSGRVTKAKEMIVGSLSGLVIIFCAWIILNTVNPELLKLKPIETVVINKINMTCCQHDNLAEMLIESECKKKSGQSFIGYWVNSQKTKCEVSGCCIEKWGNGSIRSCYNTASSNCSSPNTFTKSSCTSLVGQISDSLCPDSCANKNNGKDCYNISYAHSYCYEGLCWRGDGKEGEPCGTDKYSKCQKGLGSGFGGAGSKDCSQDLFGRDCGGMGLWCCKFKADGTPNN